MSENGGRTKAQEAVLSVFGLVWLKYIQYTIIQKSRNKELFTLEKLETETLNMSSFKK